MYRKNFPEVIIIHHTATSRDTTTFQAIESGHKARWSYFVSELGFCMGYHYLITGNGKITQARVDEEGGAHTIGWNEKSIGICLTGNFQNEQVSQKQLKSLTELLARLCKKWSIPRTMVFGHQEKSATLCPGTNLMKFIEDYRLGVDKDIQKVELMKKIKELLQVILQLLKTLARQKIKL